MRMHQKILCVFVKVTDKKCSTFQTPVLVFQWPIFFARGITFSENTYCLDKEWNKLCTFHNYYCV